MSRDVAIHRFGRKYAAVADIPGDERCLAIGSCAEVRAAISQCFPGTDWTDPAWGVFASPAGSIEFNLGVAEPSVGFMLHVRASTQIVASIIELCHRNHWQALDCRAGAFLQQPTHP